LLGGGHNLNQHFTEAIWEMRLQKSGVLDRLKTAISELTPQPSWANKDPLTLLKMHFDDVMASGINADLRQQILNHQLVEIQLDLHADCRDIEPTGSAKGEHSGNHNRYLMDHHMVGKAYFLGVDYRRNNVHIAEFLRKHQDTISVAKIDDISLDFRFIAQLEGIIAEIKSKHPDRAVVLTICGDTISGYPTSAGTNVTGISDELTKQLVRMITKETNIAGVNVAELNKFLAIQQQREGKYPWVHPPEDIGILMSEFVRVMMDSLQHTHEKS
jgi:hypothetical protein